MPPKKHLSQPVYTRHPLLSPCFKKITAIFATRSRQANCFQKLLQHENRYFTIVLNRNIFGFPPKSKQILLWPTKGGSLGHSSTTDQSDSRFYPSRQTSNIPAHQALHKIPTSRAKGRINIMNNMVYHLIDSILFS